MDLTLRPRVAVVRDARRRAAVAQAVFLVRDARPSLVGPEPTVVGSAHADALSALLDALLAASARSVRLLDARRDSATVAETFGRPVAFADDARDAESLILLATARNRRAAADAPALRAWHRSLLSGGRLPKASVGQTFLSARGGRGRQECLPHQEPSHHSSVMDIRPRLAVVDAFALGVAVAGTDMLAVDAVLASLRGRDPRSIPALARAGREGLGILEPASIEVIGDATASPDAGRLRFHVGQSGTNRRRAGRVVPERSREDATESEAAEPR